VLKVTKFPEGYPNNPKRKYVLPKGANTVEYSERGWCFAESAMCSLVKGELKVLDLAKLYEKETILKAMHFASVKRPPPLHPDDFRAELDKKTFTSKKGDFDKVNKLYARAFERHLGQAKELTFSSLQWGTEEVQKLVHALRDNSKLETLKLRFNKIGPEGAAIVADMLKTNSRLKDLDLSSNIIGSKGAVSLAEALRPGTSLQCINVAANAIGDEATAKLKEAAGAAGVKVKFYG